MKIAAVVAAAITSTALTALGDAHHSFATFDQSQERTLVGTLKEVQWTNPHIWLQVLVKTPPNDNVVEWSVEGGSPNALSRHGWRRNSLNAGDPVEIVIHPLKDGSNGGSMIRVTVNGKQIGD